MSWPAAGVAGSPTGTLVAIPDSSSGATNFATSTDAGGSWTLRGRPIAGSDAIDWNGSAFLMLYQDQWARSVDGATWTSGTRTGAPASFTHPVVMAWGPGPGRWLATFGSAARVSWSPGGNTWAVPYDLVAGSTSTVLDVAWDEANQRFLALVEDTAAPQTHTRKLYASPTGLADSWTLLSELDTAVEGADGDRLVVNASGTIVVYGNSMMAVSRDDGVTWNYPGIDRAFGALAIGNKLLYSVAPFGGTADLLISNDQGVTWPSSGITPINSLTGSRSYGGDGRNYGYLLDSSDMKLKLFQMTV